MTEITNPLRMPTTLQSPKIMGNCRGTPPHPLHIFMYTYVPLPTPPMPSHGESMTLLSEHAIFPPHHKTYMPHHLEASHTWPLKSFSAASHCSHFDPCIHHV